MEKSIKYLVNNHLVSIPSTIELGFISPAEEYCIRNDDLNDVIVISIRGKMSSQTINEKAKSNKKLELDY